MSISYLSDETRPPLIITDNDLAVALDDRDVERMEEKHIYILGRLLKGTDYFEYKTEKETTIFYYIMWSTLNNSLMLTNFVHINDREFLHELLRENTILFVRNKNFEHLELDSIQYKIKQDELKISRTVFFDCNIARLICFSREPSMLEFDNCNINLVVSNRIAISNYFLHFSKIQLMIIQPWKDDRLVPKLELEDLYIEYLKIFDDQVKLDGIFDLKLICHTDPESAKFKIIGTNIRYDPKAIRYFCGFDSSKLSDEKTDFFTLQHYYWKMYFAKPKASIEFNESIHSDYQMKLLENTYKVLLNIEGLQSERQALERYYYYFSSRFSFWKRLFYWFNGAYYNLFIPFLFITLFIYLSRELIVFIAHSESLESSPETYIVNLKRLTEEVLLKKVEYVWSLLNVKIFLAKFALLVTESGLVYSFFSFVTALKRRFGFKKI